jgi:hypothetical protein
VSFQIPGSPGETKEKTGFTGQAGSRFQIPGSMFQVPDYKTEKIEPPAFAQGYGAAGPPSFSTSAVVPINRDYGATSLRRRLRRGRQVGAAGGFGGFPPIL